MQPVRQTPRMATMTNEQIEAIWQRCKSGAQSVDEWHECGGELESVRKGDRTWQRKPGQKEWEEVPPLAGHLSPQKSKS